MKKRIALLAALLMCGVALTAQAAVTATVNKNVLAAGEILQLRLQRDGSSDEQPDISPLKKDFEVLGSSSGSSVQIINGKMTSQLQITILLSPKHDGKIQVPALRWGNEQSAPIELAVGATGGAAQQGQGNGPAANDNAHVYLTTAIDQKQPYVQAAVVLTLRLYADQPLMQASLNFPASSDVLVRQLGNDVQSSEVKNGRNFQIVERKYLLFPQRSGKLVLNGPVLDAQVHDNNANDPFGSLLGRIPFGGMMGLTQPIRVHAKAIELNVQPRPAGAGTANWLPAQKVTLEESWPQDVTTMRAGEPLTRHLQLTALGLTGAQLPDPQTLMTVPEGIKAYPDQSSVSEKPQGNTVSGSREQNIALIASRPGNYELPAVHLSWWDTQSNQKREAILPARTLNVLPAVAGSSNNAPPQITLDEKSQMSGSGVQGNLLENAGRTGGALYWMWLSFVLALLWIGTTVAWWRARQQLVSTLPVKVAVQKPQTVRVANDLKSVRQACNDNDRHAARARLLAWAKTIWPDDIPQGLNELSHRVSDHKLIEELRKLDKACYTESDWQGSELATVLPALPEKPVTTINKPALPDLYR